jgi:predicted O-linked N-acetylglucosamine transferase (SPINDLY family)
MQTGAARLGGDVRFKRAVAFHRAGNLVQARALYEEVLQEQPRHAGALHLLGVVAGQQGDFESADQLIGMAIEIDGNQTAAHANRGSVLRELGRLDAALASYDRAIAIDPGHADAYANRAKVQCELKRFDAALTDFDRAVTLNPRNAHAYFGRGSLLQLLGRHEDALLSFERVIAEDPGLAAGWYVRGAVLAALGRHQEALTSLERALSIVPDHVEALCTVGAVHLEMKQLDAALRNLDRAIAVQPRFANAHCVRAAVLDAMKLREAAISSLDLAIAARPDHPDAHYDRGVLLFSLKRHAEAAASFDRALALAPEGKGLLAMRMHAKMQLCDWHGLDADLAQLRTNVEERGAAENPYCLLMAVDAPELHRRAAENWVRAKFTPAARLGPIERRAPGGKIRIGYFSADFHQHPVAQLTAKLFETHDRSRFDVVGFSFGPDTQDTMRGRLTRAFDQFVDVSGSSDREVAQMSRSLGIDIAVDLGGFTQDSRSGIFALRAAPLQVNYLGYPGTSGAPYMDYLIADRTVVPKDSARLYSENILWLPEVYLPHDSDRELSSRPFARAEMGLPSKGFVFCCFNGHAKITQDTFDIWMRILARIPGSVLWLSSGHPTAVQNLRAEAELRGVDPGRLIFAARMQSSADHLARHRLADLFLDTLPYNAHCTASDALWSGLPVLTRVGASFAARVAASMLIALDLRELVATDRASYEDMAVRMAGDPERLLELRQRLADRRLTTATFDVPRYVDDLETAYTSIHERLLAGLPPATIGASVD